jgi:hypothetical protein
VVHEQRLERLLGALEFRREILDARIRLVLAVERRLGSETSPPYREVEWRPDREESHSDDDRYPGGSGWRPSRDDDDPTKRREALRRIFARLPPWQLGDDGWPSFGCVNAILEYEGFKALESESKLRGEFERWRALR